MYRVKRGDGSEVCRQEQATGALVSAIVVERVRGPVMVIGLEGDVECKMIGGKEGGLYKEVLKVLGERYFCEVRVGDKRLRVEEIFDEIEGEKI